MALTRLEAIIILIKQNGNCMFPRGILCRVDECPLSYMDCQNIDEVSFAIAKAELLKYSPEELFEAFL